jgi:hypothetical protein
VRWQNEADWLTHLAELDGFSNGSSPEGVHFTLLFPGVVYDP